MLNYEKMLDDALARIYDQIERRHADALAEIRREAAFAKRSAGQRRRRAREREQLTGMADMFPEH